MRSCKQLLEALERGALDQNLSTLYGGGQIPAARERAIRVTGALMKSFHPIQKVALFSGPGRTEIGGNHTDHQHGHVLCASVDMDMLACAAPNGLHVIRIQSEGYPALEIDLGDLDPKPAEENTSAALVRGVAAKIKELGYPVSGFDACITSNVLSGSGLSSSAAYEVLIGNIINHFFCGGELDSVQIAKIGQYAENIYFGRPCGLMDQMGSIAAYFGKTVLRDVPEAEFRAAIQTLRVICGDRAVLRAMHFYDDDRRAVQEAQALKEGDFEQFLSLVNASGRSSTALLQNTWSAADPKQQAVPLALAEGERLLNGAGAVRVHGGGFAGTIQAFVPNEKLAEFKAGMETLLGPGKCHILRIRPQGGCVVAK